MSICMKWPNGDSKVSEFNIVVGLVLVLIWKENFIAMRSVIRNIGVSNFSKLIQKNYPGNVLVFKETFLKFFIYVTNDINPSNLMEIL